MIGELVEGLGPDALCAAAALAEIEYIEQQNLCENAATLGRYTLGRLRDMQPNHPLMGNVTGLGLDEAGVALRPYADLEEGEYTVLVRRPGQDGQSPAQCTFSVAEFSLSPLIALLESHSYEAGKLGFRLKVIALSVPLPPGPPIDGTLVFAPAKSSLYDS